MRKFLPLAFVLLVFTAGAAIAFARTQHAAVMHASHTMLGRPAAADPARGTYLVPNCRQHKPLCDLQAY